MCTKREAIVEDDVLDARKKGLTATEKCQRVAVPTMQDGEQGTRRLSKKQQNGFHFVSSTSDLDSCSVNGVMQGREHTRMTM